MHASAVVRRELKSRGFKATPQRLAVLRAIAGTSGYFTPQELHGDLKKKHPGLGLVTVYRTLSMLTGAGLVCQIESTGKSHIYARRSSAHHHHLVCQACARVVDFNDCELDGLAKRLGRQTGFAIEGHNLEFQGLCRDCRPRKRAIEKSNRSVRGAGL